MMTVYRVTSGNKTIDFSTQTEADDYRSANGIEAAAAVLDIQQSAAPTLIDSLQNSSVAYIDFGSNLFDIMKQKTWALNTYLKIQGTPLTSQQMQTLLSASDMLQKCLETGSLLTAKDVITSMMSSLPQYSNIGTFAIAQINSFLGI
jgi:hypothetical protein